MRFRTLGGLAFGADGSLYIDEWLGSRLRKLRRGTSVFRPAPNQLVIASKDASELYTFDSTGKHVNTRDALTGAV